MGYIDSHAHLDDDRFDIDRHEVIALLANNDIDLVITNADSMDSSKKVIELAKMYDNIFATIGVHPHNAKDFHYDDIAILEGMLSFDKVVAIGEIGLDYHYDISPRDMQKNCMIEQIEIAKKYDMPIVFHVREAFGDFLDIMRAGKIPHHSVLHSYTGSIESARECLDNGMIFSFNGVITFKNAHRVREVLEYIPLDKIMLETDCPYMTPVPHRGKRNEPKHVAQVAAMIADIKKIDTLEVMKKTKENTLKFFKISET